jgi:RNA polymerase sigma-70 factor (ECF subfamily)
MAGNNTTCWTVIRGAVAGDRDDRNLFARRYEPVVRAYLAARWRHSPHRQDLDDAVQEVFADCFRPGGALDRLDPGRPGGFRAFLYGVARTAALRVETARARCKERAPAGESDLDRMADTEAEASDAFDRAWALALLREAAERQAEYAEQVGETARRRVELLRLRFHEGLPVREVARRWGCDPDAVHRDYARARREFKAALCEVVASYHPGTPAEVERECAGLLALLG